MHEPTLLAMRQSVVDGLAHQAVELARQALREGMAPLDAINQGYVPGMHHVGEEFAQRRMFLPDMLASAEAMKAALSVLEPELTNRGEQRLSLGTVVLGTVKGDIHEIGKSLVSTLLQANGFRVVDLGVDVTAEKFATRAGELNAGIVGCSALLTTTMKNQKSVVEALEREGLRPRVKVIVGGAPVTRQWSEDIGADGYGKDAVSAVALVKRLLENGSL
jgi:5-methyltetrahydrofolate--homocysteine methyltransferase